MFQDYMGVAKAKCVYIQHKQELNNDADLVNLPLILGALTANQSRSLDFTGNLAKCVASLKSHGYALGPNDMEKDLTELLTGSYQAGGIYLKENQGEAADSDERTL